MVYVFVLLAVALVIGPVMWIRPSRGQQRAVATAIGTTGAPVSRITTSERMSETRLL